MSDLPEGWSEQPLADVAFLKTGPFGSALKKSDYVRDGIPVVNPGTSSEPPAPLQGFQHGPSQGKGASCQVRPVTLQM